VLFSLLVSFTLTPMLASRWLTTREHVQRLSLFARFGAAWDRGFNRLEAIYERLLRWALDHRKTVALISVLSFVIAIAYFPLHLLGTEFVPNADQGVFTIEAHTPPGTSLAETDAAAKQLEGKLKAIPEIDHVITTVGSGNESGFQGKAGTHLMEMTVLLKDRSQRRRSVDDLLPAVGRSIQSIPGLTGRTTLPSASGGGQPLVLDLTGEDSARLTDYASQLEKRLRAIPGTRDVTNSNAAGAPELEAVVDHNRLADLGLSASQAASAVRTGITGQVVTQYRPQGQTQVDIRLISDSGSDTSISALGALPVLSSKGTTVRMDQVATIQQVDSVPQIDRRDRQRLVAVGASLDNSRALGEVTTDALKAVKDLNMPAGYNVELAGDTQLQNDSFSSFGIALSVGFLLMYMLMAALFESLLYPLAVMFSVPVSLFGAFTALVIFHENLGLFSLIGLIMLMGLVTKNAILVIDFTEKKRAEGMNRREALLHAAPIRLRPILMTSATLVVSMIPLAFKLTVGAESRASIGAVVMGGMLSSTLLSLVLVPVVYSTLDDLKQFFGGLLGRKPRYKAPVVVDVPVGGPPAAPTEPALAGSKGVVS
jgi:HAE1 family hydrophobic/amphiphilic exporter-1